MRPAALAVAPFRKGDASIPELLDATLSAIAEADGTLNSFITLADRDDLERLCCTDERGRRSNPQTRPGLNNANVVRASQLQHAVEHVDGHAHLDCLTLILARAQPVPDHAL